MELYNFVSETVCAEKDIEAMGLILSDLKKMEGMVFCEIHVRINYKCVPYYTLFGQLWGEDTSVGDTELMAIFNGEITYTWFDAFRHDDVHTVIRIQ